MEPDRGRSGRKSAPPRWVYRTLWTLHRVGYAISGGRLGLRLGGDAQLGTLRLRTLGRKSGQERASMLFYLPAGEGYAVVASNAGAAQPPAWWFNLQAQPEATIDLPGQTLAVRAREARETERQELWHGFVERRDDYERYAEVAGREIPIVILEPTDEEGHA